MSFSIFNQVGVENDDIYKLILLPKELLEYLKTPGKTLQFKSPILVKNQLVLCTESDTYQVRQMNHSNTQLIVEDLQSPRIEKRLRSNFGDVKLDPNNLLAVGLCSYLYELSPFKGEIEIGDLPLYDGSSVLISSEPTKAMQELIDDSPIAAASFKKRWHDLCGSDIEGTAVILHPNFVTEALFALVSVTIAEELNGFTLDTMAPLLAKENSKYTRSVVETIIGKFCVGTNDSVNTLDATVIARWFGIMTLKKMVTSSTDKDLLLQWKASLPPFYNALLDIKSLLGHYCRSNIGTIQYLNRSGLSSELHSRIKEMFQIAKEWDYDEFLPFVEEFVPSSKKPDAVILKHAKKKRSGKKFIVCPR